MKFTVEFYETISGVLYFFMKGRRIIAVHGIRKKATEIGARDRRVALDRKRDWLARNP
jgi:hypothetical protein